MKHDMRILIVDDSEAVRNGIAALISRDHWQVCGEAANGAQALEKARELRPDLVLLDINMPDVNGLEITRRLRKDMPEVSILIMSHYDARMLLPGALEAGANACLDKSTLATDLLRSLRSIEGNRHAATDH